jgi:hypothetical protein
MAHALALFCKLISTCIFLAFFVLAIVSLVMLLDGQLIIGIGHNALAFWCASLAMRLWITND